MYFREHGIPHFHAIYGKFEAEILVESGAILNGKLPPRAYSLVKEWATRYEDQLIQAWSKI